MCPPSALEPSEADAGYTAPEIETLIPNTPVSKDAYALASCLLHPAILNHSIRVYLYARALADSHHADKFQDAAKVDLLFTACIFHDIGTCDRYDGPQRFEVEGADAAASFLEERGVSKEDAHQVWLAIALHTSGGIAERVSDLTLLVRQGVLLDFGVIKTSEVAGLDDSGNMKEGLEKKYPRLGAEKVLGDAIVKQAVKNPKKAPKSSWPGGLYQAYLAEPDWKGVNKGF